MEANKHHWKSLTNTDYIGAYCLMQGDKNVDLVVKIKAIARKIVKGEAGKEDMCMVAELENQKPFIINATNAKMLTKLFDSPFIEDWVGRPFTLYVAKVKVAGDTVDALRIRPELPVAKTKPEMNEENQKWEGAKKAIQAGNTTIAAIRKTYTLTAENEAKLLAHEQVEAV